jgi:hypothetical protein
MKKHLSLLLLLASAASCRNNLDQYGEIFQTVMKSEDGVFRGLNINDNRQQVESEENKAADAFTDNMLLYEIALNETATLTVRYGFENGKLFEIGADIEFEKQEDGIALIEGFKKYYTAKLGAAQSAAGFVTWKGNVDGQDIRIEMSDEAELSSFNAWSLSIYRDRKL